MPIDVLGSQKSYLRCYRLSAHSEVLQLRSRQQLASLQAIREGVAEFCEDGPLESSAVLYLEKQHLPAEILDQLTGAAAFQRFCRLVAFSPEVYLMRSSENSLPTFPAQHSSSRFENNPGFAIPEPVQKVDLRNSLSLHELEVKGFLGTLSAQAGQVVVLNLLEPRGNLISPTRAAFLISQFSQDLG